MLTTQAKHLFTHIVYQHSRLRTTASLSHSELNVDGSNGIELHTDPRVSASKFFREVAPYTRGASQREPPSTLRPALKEVRIGDDEFAIYPLVLPPNLFHRISSARPTLPKRIIVATEVEPVVLLPPIMGKKIYLDFPLPTTSTLAYIHTRHSFSFRPEAHLSSDLTTKCRRSRT
ncbi:hypothetical protein CC2G_006885 [Coprinopsis cinerea AmutBmut pab1-1]|nr:hypothetical protein CC2G_006885 [Coprinopsis cinerea AmutBmut pab1-1]